MKRIKTYIKGFDELIEGGFPIGSVNLVSGNPGTGKTIFSMEYLNNGAIKNKEIGIYFTFEEKKESIIEQAEQFGFDFKKLEEKKLIKIISIGTEDISENSIKEILEIIESTKAKRVVIDSITTLSFITPEQIQNYSINQFTIKKFLYFFITKLKENKELTSILISQKDEKTSDNLSKYLCDGVINIEFESMGGDFSRTLIINKMRKTKNDEDLHSLEINNQHGIIIHKME